MVTGSPAKSGLLLLKLSALKEVDVGVYLVLKKHEMLAFIFLPVEMVGDHEDDMQSSSLSVRTMSILSPSTIDISDLSTLLSLYS